MARLETERTVLRPFRPNDLPDVFAFCSQPEIESVGWDRHQNVAETKAVLENWIKNPNFFAIEEKTSGQVIGYLHVQDDSEDGLPDVKELGFALHRDYHRRGFMSEIVPVVLDWLFSHGIQSVWACCFQNNLACKSLIEKIGFRFMQEGTFYFISRKKNIPSFEYCMTKEEWKNRK